MYKYHTHVHVTLKMKHFDKDTLKFEIRFLNKFIEFE